MFYIVVENNQITSVLNYEPNVPDGLSVTAITDEQNDSIVKDKTHYFDIADLTVKSYAQSYIDAEIIKKDQEETNAENREFLRNSDWKVFRHIRQKALGQPTTLTDQEYLDLEQARADAAAAIVEIQ